jgi:lactate dehydrogenase-like 2-hydroxyacid dehydrogenase
MNKVYVTRMVPEESLARLRRHFEFEINMEDRSLTREELKEKVRGREAIISLLGDRIDGEILDAAGPQLKIVANFAVGFDNLDLAAATERGVILTNTPGVLDDATAGLALALILATARRVAEGDRYVRAGQWTGAWSPGFFVGRDVDGATLGIVGAGRIGRNLARKARAFDMRLLYTGRRRQPDFEEETGAIHVDKAELLAQSDFVSLSVPLTPQTRHYIGAEELAAMKPTAILINTSRGPVVDEKALVEALRTRRIWGAGLDVFEDEPRLAPGLAELDNVVLLPHIASATPKTRQAMGDLAIDNVLKVLRGEPPISCINPEVLAR